MTKRKTTTKWTTMTNLKKLMRKTHLRKKLKTKKVKRERRTGRGESVKQTLLTKT